MGSRVERIATDFHSLMLIPVNQACARRFEHHVELTNFKSGRRTIPHQKTPGPRCNAFYFFWRDSKYFAKL